jgi:spermidine/putrescine transport system permease protein
MSKKHKQSILAFPTLVIYAFLYLPIVVLVIFSFNSARINAIWTGFTLQWYRELVADFGIQQALKNSLTVSLTAASLATLIGTLAAHALHDTKLASRALINNLLYLPLIIPDIVIGVALVMLYVSVKLELGMTTLVFSHLVFDSSYATIIVLARLQAYDARIEEAAMDLGATRLKTFFTIKMPLISPAVVGAALLAFTLSFDDFVISFMTSGVGTTTLPIRIYSMTRFGVSPMINAISTLIILFTVASIAVVHILIAKTHSAEISFIPKSTAGLKEI